MEEKRATIYCDQDRGGVYVLASVFTPEHKAMCLIEGSHSNIVKVTADGETTFEKERPSGASSGFADDGFPTLSPTFSGWPTKWTTRTRILSGRASR